MFVMQLEEARWNPEAFGVGMITGRPLPATFAELASAYGGANLEAGVNPYPGAPMKQVSLADKSPGDNTLHEHSEGFAILFHYLDEQNGVSTRVVGLIH